MKKVISIALALCLCLVCFVGCGEKPPEGYEGWKVKKLLNTISYCVPKHWKLDSKNKNSHTYKINDSTTLYMSIESETKDGFTSAIEIVGDYEKKKEDYEKGRYSTPSMFVRDENCTIDNNIAYHYQLDPFLSIVDNYIDYNMYDIYVCDCSKGIFTIEVIFDRNMGNFITEDEMNKFLESIQFKDFEAKEE